MWDQAKRQQRKSPTSINQLIIPFKHTKYDNFTLYLFAISNQIWMYVQGSYAFVEYEVEKHAEDAM